MEYTELMLQESLQQLETTISLELNAEQVPQTIDAKFIEKCSSDLDGWDYCFSILIGLSGTFISSNEAFGKYLDEIHKAASGAGGDYDFFQQLIGKLLHHEGDYIDMIERPFKNRAGGNANCLFHRLLWGHDILDIGEDNPFALMFKQKGMLGVLQAFRHLLADTCSKQGLPLPGSSFFDYDDAETGKRTNYMIEVAKRLSDEAFDVKNRAQEIYSHIFTLHAQDFAGGTVVKAFSSLYFLLRKTDDNIRKAQILFIAYAVNFFLQAIIGAIKQNGVPFINIPVGTAMATEFGKFCYYNAMEISQITKETKRIVAVDEALISANNAIDELLSEHDTADEYFARLKSGEQNIGFLISALSEDEI